MIKYKRHIIITIFIFGILTTILFAFYSKNIHFAGVFNIKTTDTALNVITTTPLGRQQIQANSFYGYFKEIKISSTKSAFEITQDFLNHKEILPVIKSNSKFGYVKSSGFTFIQKLKAFFIISKRDILLVLLLIIMMAVSSYIVFFIGRFLYRSRRHIINQFLLKCKNVLSFLKKYNYKIVIPIFISFIPGTIYLIFDPALTTFMNINRIPLILLSSLIFVVPFFLVVFHNPLKINLNFWLTFLIIFILYFLVFFPEIYIYGNYFRDDISKFFVKAYENNLYQLLSTTDANYLNTYQSLIPFILLKILGIKQYFPEIMQITVLFSIAFIYASFNLKIFREVCNNDRLRLAISIAASFIVLLFGRTLFMFEVPFLAALLFWPVLFLKMDKLSNITFGILILFFILFILSKPIFVVYIPLILIIIVYAKFSKQKKLFLGMLVLMMVILLQFAVNYFNQRITISPVIPDGLGTNVINAFRQNDMSFSVMIEYSLYVFIRSIVRLIFPYIQEPCFGNIFINLTAFLLIVFVNAWFFIRYLKSKRIENLFMVSGSVIALIVCFLFVKTISLRYLQAEQGNILNFNFFQLLQSDYLPPPHRYLILAYFPLATVFIYFIIINLKRYNKISEKWLVILLCIYFSFSSFKPFYYYISSIKKPKNSIWRQYSKLIFLHPDMYYIPYYGYPAQSESIRHGIDRITDVKTSKDGTIYMDSLQYDTKKWEIIQLITEYHEETSAKITGVKAVTRQNDTLFLKPFYPVSPEYRFIIFRFDELIRLKEIKFLDKQNNPVYLSETIRLVGKYE
jgi:hypothetical protein